MPWTYDVSLLADDAVESDGSDADDTTAGDGPATDDATTDEPAVGD
jgi:hypothetical protein